MPVQAAKINWCEVLRAEVTTHATQEEPCDHDHANDDVGSVQTGHGVVNAKVEVGIGRTLGIHSRIRVVSVVIMPPVTCVMSMVTIRMMVVITMIVMVIAVIMMVVVLVGFGLFSIEHRQPAS